jgi:hypothetical protein
VTQELGRPPRPAAYAPLVRQQAAMIPPRCASPIWAWLWLTFGISCGPSSFPPLEDPSASPRVIAQFEGCWQLSPATSMEPLLPGGLIVRLDTVRIGATEDNQLRLVVDTSQGYRSVLAGWGILRKPNRILAYWGDGFTGLELKLGFDGDSLSGRAYRVFDLPPSRSSFKVRAGRTECPAGV